MTSLTQTPGENAKNVALIFFKQEQILFYDNMFHVNDYFPFVCHSIFSYLLLSSVLTNIISKHANILIGTSIIFMVISCRSHRDVRSGKLHARRRSLCNCQRTVQR